MVVLQVHGGGARGRDRSDDGAYAMIDTTSKSKEGRQLPLFLWSCVNKFAPLDPELQLLHYHQSTYSRLVRYLR